MQSIVSDEDIAAEVRAWMARQRRSQRELSEFLGMGQMAVSQRLSAETPIRATEIVRIAEFLGVSVETLLAVPTAA